MERFFSDEEEEVVTEDRKDYVEDEDRYVSHADYRRRTAYDDMDDFIAEEDEDEVMEEDRGVDYVHEAPRRGRPANPMMDILPEGLSEE